MKKILFYIICLVAVAYSCSNKEPVPTDPQVYKLRVTLPGLKKTSIAQSEENYYIYWCDGDVISVGDDNLSSPLTGVADKAVTAEFSFNNPINNGDLVLYPASENPGVLVIPAEQNSLSGQYDPSLAPLWGKVSLGAEDLSYGTLTLNNTMAVLRFLINGETDLTSVSIKALGDEPLNGQFDLSASGVISNPTGTTSTTEIVFDSPVALSPEDGFNLYLPLIPSTYSKGFDLTLSSNSGEMTLSFFKDGQQLKASDIVEFETVFRPGVSEVIVPLTKLDPDSSVDLPSEDAAYDDFLAEGRVVYNDGLPAEGIKVSDGFTVVQTDAEGYYSFKTAGKDVRYIYISYPSDAVISKSAEGCPDFYQTYKTDKYIYDFTLTRQQVEKEFVLFALSDPQVHHEVRGTQLTTDANRFLWESVPAINAELAKQTLPSYGVVLGDIIYSEEDRNSTPALSIMRSHFSKINMPLFSIMGNHDYTFYKSGQTITANESSTTINLLSQRSFEGVFGPVNYSFDRGDVHFVCMKDVYYNCETEWQWDDYTGGFTDEEYQWLVQDLEKTSKDKMVVLCVHIPIAQSSNGPNVQNVGNLLKTFANAMIFSGDAHYQRGVENSAETGIFEKVHTTLCGQWWWSKIQGDGCPNGYTVYTFDGTDVKDSYLIGVNEGMNTRDYQMRIYKGNICSGGEFAYFQLPYTENDYLINVFNGDPRWTVKVYEDEVLKGEAQLMSRSRGDTFPSVTKGETYTFKENTSRDWWAIGYHIGYCGRGATGTSYYTANYHMWKWTASDSSVKVTAEAVDPYGNVYTCEDVVTDGTDYPDYIKKPLSVF